MLDLEGKELVPIAVSNIYQIEESEDENDSSSNKTESGFVHHYNPSLIPSNPSQSTTNPSNLSEEGLKREFETACGVEDEEEEEVPDYEVYLKKVGILQ